MRDDAQTVGAQENRSTARKAVRGIASFVELIDELAAGLESTNHAQALELARIPEHIRGYGHVKQAHLAIARAKQAEALARWRAPVPVTA